jgi:hypothetical protein
LAIAGFSEIYLFWLEVSSHDASGAVPSGHQSLDPLALANRKRRCHIQPGSIEHDIPALVKSFLDFDGPCEIVLDTPISRRVNVWLCGLVATLSDVRMKLA